jgi:D-alanyl-D-alanine carboxypeptidase
MQNGSAMYAAAGMVSTAPDMATYMTALLSGRLLDPATYSLMWTSTATPHYKAKPASDDMRGLGWDTAIDAGARPKEVAKSGLVPGFSSELILHPASDSGVFVSFNASYSGGRNPDGVSALAVAESVYKAIHTGTHRPK